MATSDVQLVLAAAILAALAFTNGVAGEIAFGGLHIYGPHSPKIRPVDSVALVAFLLSGVLFVYMCVIGTKNANIEFGEINMPIHLSGAILAITLPVAVLLMLCNVAIGLFADQRWAMAVISVAAPLILVLLLYTTVNLRGPGVGIPVALLSIVSASPSAAGNFTNCYTSFMFALLMFPVCRARYLRDHRLIVGFAFSTTLYVITGGSIMISLMESASGEDKTPALVSCFVLATLAVASSALLVLATRIRRELPKELTKCRFVSLAYLRASLQLGWKIQRCQDVPAEACGDPGKSAELLITSHRWLDRHSCDIATLDYPHGTRLTTMTQRLNEIYPETWWGQPFSHVWDSMKLGGNDVLVFFDFMGLPQVGKQPDGSLIERTEEEAAVFSEALPHMGALYTMYPVFVLTECTPDVSPYESSGWCFSEFCSALLTGQLDKYSAAAENSYKISDHFTCMELILKMSGATIDDQTANEFIEAFDADLSKRKFFNEDDRQIVRRIVMGYLVVRQLTDAVRLGSESEVKKLLAHVNVMDLQHVLHHAVEDSMDTLLHIAVQSGGLEVVKLLLDAGATPEQRNYRGDRPDQWLMLPRCSGAAAQCRQLLRPAYASYAAVSASPRLLTPRT